MHLQTILGQGPEVFPVGDVFGSGVEGMNFNLEGSSSVFLSRDDPPSLPPHLRQESGQEQAARQGVLAGLTRAGQAIRRRVVDPVLQHVTRTPPPPTAYAAGDGHYGGTQASRSAFPPTVAEAMQEWTARTSLLTPGPQGPLPLQEESSASSISPEMVMEEVKKQVHLAMASKDLELQELRQQNEALRRAAQQSSRLFGEDGGSDARVSVERPRGSSGGEPVPSFSAQGPEVSVPQGDPHLLYDRAGVSGRIPLRAGGPQSVPVSELGGRHDRSVLDGRRPGEQDQPPEQSPGPAQTTATEKGTVVDEPLHLLVQGMRQLQQAYLGKTDAKDTEVKGSVEIPAMPDLGSEASVAFADWLYELEQAVGGLTDKASVWFKACLEVARQTYVQYTMASPLTRLSLQPVIPEELKDQKWARLERRVMTLLLGAMKRPAKEDAITHRIADVPSLLYRLHVLYQPGGVSERAAVLRHLEGRLGGEDVHECVAALRKWRRYVERAEAMNVTVPDPEILLKAVELMVKKVLAAYPEVKFRTDLMKNELQLQGRPTLDGVLRFHTHVLAELQMIAPVSGSSSPAALKAIGSGHAGTGEATSPPSSPTRKTGSKAPCKYFLSKTGCSRGSGCKYEHTFDSKEDKKTRCWECGSQGHRKGECPVAIKLGKGPKSTPKSDTLTTSTSTPAVSSLQLQPPVPSVQNQQTILESIQATPPPTGTASSSSSQTMPTAMTEASASRDGEVRELLKEANAMLSRLTKLQALEVQTNVSVGELSAAIKAAGLEDEQGFALLDSGASHAFKTAERGIVEQASPVRVELAGGQYVTLKQNRAGTLLAAADDPQAAGATSILPLGALVQQLGCELTWTRKGGLKVVHPEFGVLKTFVKGNHPMLAETQALEIISQLEEQHLQSLETSTAETFVRTLDYEDVKSWDFLLGKFVATGGRECLLEALSSSCSPFGELSSDVISLAAVHVGLDDKQGWKYLKALLLNRNLRKSMMTKRWVVRLYRREGEADLQVSNSEDVVTVDCNLARSKRFSIKGESAMYKALMWAAARGQIEGVLGSPPVNDGHELLAKQLLLWTVSRQAAFMRGASPPYLLLGSTPSSSMWKSEMWSSFRQEYHVPMMQVETHGDGSNYLIATNLAMKGRLLPPDSVEVSEALTTKAWPNVWKLPFQHDLGAAVDRWRLRPDELFLGYMLHKLDSDTPWSDKDLRYWKRHVANGHLPFDRRCKTCIQTAATGRAHRRIIAPSCYTLSLDVCGPFRKKGEYGGSKGFRYALIGTYIMPKLSVYKDVPIPEESEVLSDAEGPEGDFLDEQGPADPPLDPEDQEDLDKSNKRFQALYKEVGDAMDYQTLHYAIPLKTRLTPEIEDAVKQVYLQIRSEGLPVTRVHSDRARELRGSKLRTWLLHRDVLPTTGEAQAPQTNGRAEAGVKRAKVRTKTLLRAAGLDTSCWPFAMAFAAFQQRECALGRDRALIPFGSPVLVKNKVYGTGGHFDLDERWQGGVYVGPSHELRQGHVVRFPTGRIVTSLHLRSGFEDPDSAVPLAAFEKGNWKKAS